MMTQSSKNPMRSLLLECPRHRWENGGHKHRNLPLVPSSSRAEQGFEPREAVGFPLGCEGL